MLLIKAYVSIKDRNVHFTYMPGCRSKHDASVVQSNITPARKVSVDIVSVSYTRRESLNRRSLHQNEHRGIHGIPL